MSSNGHKPSIAMAMSGGVDSSVAAAVLVNEGYTVVGFTLKLWDAEDADHARKVCCTTIMARDAGRVCEQLGIPHYTLDLRDRFRTEVVERFEREYMSGRTPNPCVHCNSQVKWGAMWDIARKQGLERIATGHYARIVNDDSGQSHLMKGLDPAKDQSYFLWEIPRSILSLTVFPLGNQTKSDTRAMARDLGLHVSEKEESQEVCFVPADDYRGWLKKRQTVEVMSSLSGEIKDTGGQTLGTHEGFPLFTIGQRKGLGLGGGGRKLYVTKIDSQNRNVIVGDKEDLYCDVLTVTSLNIHNESAFRDNNNLKVKIRYNSPEVEVKIKEFTDSGVIAETGRPVEAITPGQSAVFYMGNEVVAGGIIG